MDDSFDPRTLDLTKMLIPNCTQDILNLLNELPCVKNNLVEHTNSGFDCMDITAKHAHKGSCAKILSKQYGFSLENTMALGDNFNDADMLACVGYPIVPASADEKIRKMANFVTSNSGQNPITTAIHHLFPDLLVSGLLNG